MAAGEGVEPSFLRSERSVIPITPSHSICSRALGLMAPGEGVEPSSLDSKSNVLPITPSRNSGYWDSNPEPCADLALIPLIRRLLCQLSYTPACVALCTLYLRLCLGPGEASLAGKLLVDPTGLKPAPYGLKGRRSVTRAPDQ